MLLFFFHSIKYSTLILSCLFYLYFSLVFTGKTCFLSNLENFFSIMHCKHRWHISHLNPTTRNLIYSVRYDFIYIVLCNLNFTNLAWPTFNSWSFYSASPVLVWRCVHECPNFPHLVLCYKAGFLSLLAIKIFLSSTIIPSFGKQKVMMTCKYVVTKSLYNFSVYFYFFVFSVSS